MSNARDRSLVFEILDASADLIPLGEARTRVNIKARGQVNSGGYSDPGIDYVGLDESGTLHVQMTVLPPRANQLVNAACWSMAAEAAIDLDVPRARIVRIVVSAATNHGTIAPEARTAGGTAVDLRDRLPADDTPEPEDRSDQTTAGTRG